MNILKTSLITSLVFLTCQLIAQNPTPAPTQAKSIGIVGATAHLGTGEVIVNSFIAFENGKITQVSKYNTSIDLNAYDVIHAKGKHVYPGFIAANSTLGLVEVGAIRSTHDERETGSFNPNIRAIIAYNTDSEVIPTIRNHGVLSAQVCPRGGRVSGSSSVVHLDAWNWEDAALLTDEGMHLNWPSRFSFNFRTRQLKKNEKYEDQLKAIEKNIEEAKAYSKKAKHANKNLKFEAMLNLFAHKQKLYIHTDEAQSITQAVLFSKKYDIDIVIVGGRNAWRVVDVLKENNIPVILSKTQNLPQRADEDIDQPFKTPALLEEAGILYCISMNGYWTVRNLGFQAGQAVGFGLEYEKAVRAITLNPARILGIDKQMGSIEVGKDATLFISQGDALDMRSSLVERAFIQGRDVSLEDKQKFLQRKFTEKYKRSGGE